jgi:signal transduction histidine kinase
MRDGLRAAGGRDSAALRAVAGFHAAIHGEFRLLAAGRIGAAHRFATAVADPAYRRLTAALERIDGADTAASDRAGVLAVGGDAVVVGAGFLAVSVLALWSAATRRALATAEIEQRLLEQNDRAKSELITIVSHDLRTPLTSVVGYLEMIADGDAGPLSGEQHALIGVAQRSAGRLQAIVSDLLFISRARSGRLELHRQELSLERAAANAIEEQRPQATGKRIQLSLRAVPAPPVLADPERVDELMENLLSNALKFTPPGGQVQVAVRPADGHVRLEVTDTGKGIPAEDQRHVFEQFFRSREVSGLPGVGLGLSIVKSIADAHHARLSLRSAPGRGSTFGVEFPVSAGPSR